MLSSLASSRRAAVLSARRFSDGGVVRRAVSLEERAALRAARKERAQKMLQKESSTAQTATTNTVASPQISASTTRYMWYASVLVPAGLLAWALNDPDSPPAQLSRMIGLTQMITGVTSEIAKPAHEKLLPDWSQVSSSPRGRGMLPTVDLLLDLSFAIAHPIHPHPLPAGRCPTSPRISPSLTLSCWI